MMMAQTRFSWVAERFGMLALKGLILFPIMAVCFLPYAVYTGCTLLINRLNMWWGLDETGMPILHDARPANHYEPDPVWGMTRILCALCALPAGLRLHRAGHSPEPGRRPDGDLRHA